MIEGITVLNKIAVTGVPSWMMVSAIIISIIGFIVFAIAINAKWPAWKAIVPIIIILFIWLKDSAVSALAIIFKNNICASINKHAKSPKNLCSLAKC